MPSLKFLIALPIPRPSPGRRLAPKMMTMIARMIRSSGRPTRPMVWLLEAAIVLLFGAKPGAGQFTSGVSVVEVYASVTDLRGEPVTGLRAADFEVLEDGVPQPVTTFAAGD